MRRILSALCLSTALGLTAALPAQAADGPVTPTAPVVVDECGVGQDSVTIPDIDGVRYFFDVGDAVVELTPGAYAGIAFLPDDALADDDLEDVVEESAEDETWELPDAAATIRAEATDGHVLADGAIASFDVSLSSAPCASDNSPVTATSTECGSVTFANPAGNPEALVLWVDAADEVADFTEISLAPGDSRTVTTSADDVFWFAVEASAWDEDFGWGTTLGATTPDVVATPEDREALKELAEWIDILLDDVDLGEGTLNIDQDCSTPPVDQPGGTDAPTTPEIPAVVQTDGIAQQSPVVPVALGGLTALAGLLVLRRPRRS